jgi:hypothetical protein
MVKMSLSIQVFWIFPTTNEAGVGAWILRRIDILSIELDRPLHSLGFAL